jgi:hypothetical protein
MSVTWELGKEPPAKTTEKLPNGDLVVTEYRYNDVNQRIKHVKKIKTIKTTLQVTPNQLRRQVCFYALLLYLRCVVVGRGSSD